MYLDDFKIRSISTVVFVNLRLGSYSNWVFFRIIPFRSNGIHQCILIEDVVKRRKILARSF